MVKKILMKFLNSRVMHSFVITSILFFIGWMNYFINSSFENGIGGVIIGFISIFILIYFFKIDGVIYKNVN